MMRHKASIILGLLLAAWLPVVAATPVCRVADPELIGDFAGSCDAEGYATGPGAAPPNTLAISAAASSTAAASRAGRPATATSATSSTT